MGILDETYVCERCNRTVNEMTSTCGDLLCPLFDPRYEEQQEETWNQEEHEREQAEWRRRHEEIQQ